MKLTTLAGGGMILVGITTEFEFMTPLGGIIIFSGEVSGQIIEKYENVKNNKKKVSSLLARVRAIESSIQPLIREREENPNNFAKRDYYRSFLRLIESLIQSKKFIEEVSQVSRFKKFMSSDSIKTALENLTDELNICINDLNFAVEISSKERGEKDMEEILETSDEISRAVVENREMLETVTEISWKDVQQDFNYQLRKKWERGNLNRSETKLCIEGGLSCLEHEFATCLKKDGYDLSNLVSLNLTEVQEKTAWRDIRYGFSHGKRMEWEKVGMNHDETKEWIDAGTELDDYKFVAWLRDIKKETPQWITIYKEDYQTLSERFKKYGLCKECNQPNTGEQWCKDCNTPRLKQNFKNWTSKNPQIDQFIQKYQLEATEANKLLEWIPHEQFEEIEYLAEGGFGKVYKAKWKEGNISRWDTKNKQWKREKDYEEVEEKDLRGENKKVEKSKTYREVALKSLNNFQENINIGFLDEAAKHKLIDDWFQNIVPCYGLSQDPETGNYLMVMKYIEGGNLRSYLDNKNQELTLQDKLNHLVKIAQGLKDIHQKNLVHRDFHSGNILKGIEKASCLITDLGLCRPANEASKEDQIFGVMPYVAPEVLRSQPYTQKADIYSFGIIAYEVLSGLPPYYDREHDVNLGVAICNGLRPSFQIKIPQLLEDLIKRCWDTDPSERPTTLELEKTLRNWKKDTQFQNQIQEAEEYNKNLAEEIRFPNIKEKKHRGAVYTSRLLPTKEITRLLTEKFSQSLQINFEEENQTFTEQIQDQRSQIIQQEPFGVPSSSKPK